MPAVGWGNAPQDRRWGSLTSKVLGNFQVNYSFSPHSMALGSTEPLIDISTKGFPSCKVQLAHTADRSAILDVPDVKVGMEAQHPIPGLSLHYLLEGSFTFTFYSSTDCHGFFPNSKSMSFLIIWQKMPICCYSYVGFSGVQIGGGVWGFKPPPQHSEVLTKSNWIAN